MNSNYSREPKSSLEGYKDFCIGSLVRLSATVFGEYCGVAHLIDKTARVAAITRHTIDKRYLSDKVIHMYVSKYGARDTYDIVGLWIVFPEDNRGYLVSPFGVEKVV